MSSVTSIILTCATLDDENLEHINKWLLKEEYIHEGHLATWSDETACGTKGFHGKVMLGGFNYFRYLEFADMLSELKWHLPENVQLFKMHKSEDTFTPVLIPFEKHTNKYKYNVYN